MDQKGRKFLLTSKSFIYAVAVHAVIGALLLVNLGLDKNALFAPSRPSSDAKPVEAMVLTEADIDRQMALLKQKDMEELAKAEQAQKKLEELERQARAAEEKRKQEERKIAEEQQKLAQIQEKKKQEAIKAKELAQQRKEQEMKLAKLEKEKQAKLEAEKKKKAAQEKKRQEEKKKKELAAKKKREAERRKQAELARIEAEKRRKEAELQARLEQERIDDLFSRALSRYTPIIRQKVSRNWNQPANTQRGIIARVVVRLTSTGEVISAQVIQSSGNPIFDRSVENAVYKASPLPIPRERGINEKFRNLNLTFKPEDLIS